MSSLRRKNECEHKIALKVELNEEGAAPCKHCLRSKKKKVVYPKIVNVEGLYYAQCPECSYYDIYEFLGASHKKAIQVWNNTMLYTGSGCCSHGEDQWMK